VGWQKVQLTLVQSAKVMALQNYSKTPLSLIPAVPHEFVQIIEVSKIKGEVNIFSAL
jgi:hypothetical protein